MEKVLVQELILQLVLMLVPKSQPELELKQRTYYQGMSLERVVLLHKHPQQKLIPLLLTHV
jgi:hypothetical protein